MQKINTILVTGAAGFIGYHLCQALINLGHNVVGLDNINNYYSVDLKYDRLNQLGIIKDESKIYHQISKSKIYGEKMQFIRINLEDRKLLPKLFKDFHFDIVCNLAAQPGVRYSLQNPEIYIDSNINGFLNILECCRNNKIRRLVYASSSSVYGNSEDVPFKEDTNVDRPISLYAATKKSNELLAHTYSHLFQIETIGLRFFTVYGPWGRPDMAIFLFPNAITKNEPIKVFNHGKLSRDFTYIDDVIGGLVKTIIYDSRDLSIYKLYNIGNNKPVKLMNFISSIEKNLGKKAVKKMLPMQPGDVNQTWADVSKLQSDYDYEPTTSVDVGVSTFMEWYKSYYNLK